LKLHVFVSFGMIYYGLMPNLTKKWMKLEFEIRTAINSVAKAKAQLPSPL
jgi:hypothetical protein